MLVSPVSVNGWDLEFEKNLSCFVVVFLIGVPYIVAYRLFGDLPLMLISD
jgi:hypothetical protein